MNIYPALTPCRAQLWFILEFHFIASWKRIWQDIVAGKIWQAFGDLIKEWLIEYIMG